MKTAPLHQRIRADIEHLILSGAWAPGHRMPSEAELMRQYGCARMTVNKALSSLTSAGLIERRKRAGSFVARPRNVAMVLDVPDLRAEIERRGQTYRYRLLRREPISSNAALIDLGLNGSALAVDGIHDADGRPFCHEVRYVALDAVPEISEQRFETESPGSWLLRHVPWTEAENRIGATGADAVCAAALAIAAGSPCLQVERRTWRGAQTITVVRQTFPAGSYELVARFGADRRP